jgi:hypothetical protein
MKENVTATSTSVSRSSSPEPMQVEAEVEEVDDRLNLENVTFIGSGHKKCVMCRKPVSCGMTIMPKPARLDLLLLHRLFAPHGVRCCLSHLFNRNRLRPDEQVNNQDCQQFPTFLSPQEARDLFNDLFSLFDELRSSSRLDFDDPSLTDEDYEAWTGWTKNQFNLMFENVSRFLRSSSNRTTRNAFAIFWIKIKTNLSFRQIGSLFNMSGDPDRRRMSAANAFDSVRELLIEHFVPNHLGIGHITVDDAAKHNTAYTKVR